MVESLEELQEQLQVIEEQIEEHRRHLQSRRKEIYKIEDRLLESKEKALKLVIEIQEFRQTQDLSTLIDHHRSDEIEAFKQKAPSLLRQLLEEDKKDSQEK